MVNFKATNLKVKKITHKVRNLKKKNICALKNEGKTLLLTIVHSVLLND